MKTTAPGPRVWNARDDYPSAAVYVGRATRFLAGSPFGNPFRIRRLNNSESPDYARARVIAAYRAWLLARPDLVAAVKRELRGRHLVCWCAPLPCHADVLLEIANAEEK